MIVRTVSDIAGTDRDVHGTGWKSRRLLLAEDGLPVSVHETIVEAGAELRFCYRRHSETVYCVEGKGSVENVAANRLYPISPGTIYSVGIGDEHIVRAETDIKFLCIFDPPLIADESAD